MGFFEEVVPEPADLPSFDARRYDAQAPRGSMLPKAVPAEQIIARNSHTTVALGSVQAWHSNLTLEFVFFSHFYLEYQQSLMFYSDHPRRRAGLPGPQEPRIAVLFSDGRYATNLRAPGYPRSHERGLCVEFPVLTQVSGGSGGGGGPAGGFWHLRQVLDLWPLPPAGPVVIIFSWLAQGIAERSVELSGQEILDAALRCVPVFDRPPG